MAKPLTIQLIQQKTKTDQLTSIKNLNLWGNDLDDLKALRQLPNLEVLSLSVNRISSLKEIGACSKLKELYLRKNEIEDINELQYVVHLQNLKVLWLQDNPCSEIPNYRHIVLGFLPNLDKLDNMAVTTEDREAGKKFIPNKNGNVNMHSNVNVNVNSSKYYQPQHVNDHSYYRQQPNILREQKEDDQMMRGSQVHSSFNTPSQQQQIYGQYQQPYQLPKYNEPEEPQYLNNYEEKPAYNRDRNDNILCAVLALMNELDEANLQVVLRNVEMRLGKGVRK